MRIDRKPEELKRLAADLREVAGRLDRVAREMHSEGVSKLSVHSVTQLKRDVPSLLSWVEKVSAEWARQRDEQPTDGPSKPPREEKEGNQGRPST